MKCSFEGQVVVITGAAGGLGSAYAHEIAKRGGAVVANDLGGDWRGQGRSRSVDAVVERITTAGGQAVANYDSVAEPSGGEALLQTALDAFGRVDAVINNAGNIMNAWFEDFSPEALNRLLAVHVAGAFNVTRPIYRVMKQQGYGRILFTSSASGVLGNATQAGYGAAKGAVIGLMNCLAQEGAPHHVLCNALLPSASGRMTESMLPENIGNISETTSKFAAALNPENVAPLAAYLVSRDCTSNHGIYSATGNRFCRAFIGMTDGWLAPPHYQPTVEDIAEHFRLICDQTHYTEPKSIGEEYAILADRLSKLSS